MSDMSTLYLGLFQKLSSGVRGGVDGRIFYPLPHPQDILNLKTPTPRTLQEFNNPTSPRTPHTQDIALKTPPFKTVFAVP
jgi:hypothetical protein